MTTINYRLILDELVKGIIPSENLKTYEWMTSRHYLTEFKTVGFTSTRQTGKTQFIASLVDEGQAIAVCHSDPYKNNYTKDIQPAFQKRVLCINDLAKDHIVKEFKNKDIQFVCLDEIPNLYITDKAFDLIRYVFGDDVIIIKT